MPRLDELSTDTATSRKSPGGRLSAPADMDRISAPAAFRPRHAGNGLESDQRKHEPVPTVQESIEVDAPVRAAYRQWTLFATFPDFMEGVEEVRQIDDTHLLWVANFAGERNEWQAEITEQVWDQRIAWRRTGGMGIDGTVTFESLDKDRTRVTVGIHHEADRLVETGGSRSGVDDQRVKGDLERFRDLLERRRNEHGDRSGHVHRDAATGSSQLTD